MPWDMKENKPSAVKYLHPKIQRKAIRIANAIVEDGGDEGIAIATGIKKAKSLIKLALEIPVSHLKNDTKEINEIRSLAQRIVKITRGMNKEDKDAMG